MGLFTAEQLPPTLVHTSSLTLTYQEHHSNTGIISNLLSHHHHNHYHMYMPLYQIALPLSIIASISRYIFFHSHHFTYLIIRLLSFAGANTCTTVCHTPSSSAESTQFIKMRQPILQKILCQTFLTVKSPHLKIIACTQPPSVLYSHHCFTDT